MYGAAWGVIVILVIFIILFTVCWFANCGANGCNKCCTCIEKARVQCAHKILNKNSNIPGLATLLNTESVNSWGVDITSTDPTSGRIWVSQAGAGVVQEFSNQGTTLVTTVTVPPAPTFPGIGQPSALQLTRATTGYVVKSNTATWVVATLDGTVCAFNSTDDASNAVLVIDNSVPPGVNNLTLGAVYTGLAVGSVTNGVTKVTTQYLWTANFKDGAVEVYDSSWTFIKAFTDPALTIDASDPGFAPFGLYACSTLGYLFVSFAFQDDTRSIPVKGAGLGFIDVFTMADGTFVSRLATGQFLNAPISMQIAPLYALCSCSCEALRCGCSQCALACTQSKCVTVQPKRVKALLVSNFGDGTISVLSLSCLDPYCACKCASKTAHECAFIGQLHLDGVYDALSIDGLRSIRYCNEQLFATSGPLDGAGGIFAKIKASCRNC